MYTCMCAVAAGAAGGWGHQLHPDHWPGHGCRSSQGVRPGLSGTGLLGLDGLLNTNSQHTQCVGSYMDVGCVCGPSG